MDETWTPVLGWAFFILLFLLFVPPSVLLLARRVAHKRRQKMVNGPRKIKVARDDEEPVHPCAATGHQRSKRNAKQAADGSYVSVCRTCGVKMRRNGPGDWEAVS